MDEKTTLIRNGNQHQIICLLRSGEDIWKAMGIVEVMQKTHQYIPPEVQELVDRQLERQQVMLWIHAILKVDG